METLRQQSGAGDLAGHYWVCREAGELFSSVGDGKRDPPREARGWGRWSGAGMQAVNLGLCRMPLRHL